MAYLTEEKRAELKAELEKLSFRQAHGRLKRMDKGRLAFYRNAQYAGKWMTRWVLEGMGVVVTLVEANVWTEKEKANRIKNDYNLIDVIVEPTPDNRL